MTMSASINGINSRTFVMFNASSSVTIQSSAPLLRSAVPNAPAMMNSDNSLPMPGTRASKNAR